MNNTQREQKELQVGEVILVVKTYATAREANAIQQAYFKGSKVEVVGTEPKISEFNANAQFEVEQELIRQMVVSFNGETENILDNALNLPADVFSEIVKELDALVSKKKS